MIDLNGIRFERLLVIAGDGIDRRGEKKWQCRCDCGNMVSVLSSNLRRGNTRSCGCIRVAVTGDRSRIHAMSREPMYYAWVQMKQRCYNSHNHKYKDYGARGITVCDRWRNDYAVFFADMGERPEGLSIDRLENDGNYEPGNCRWATPKQQAANKRNFHKSRNDILIG